MEDSNISEQAQNSQQNSSFAEDTPFEKLWEINNPSVALSLRCHLSACWLTCPLCGINKPFNSRKAVEDAMEMLTDQDKIAYAMAITDYTGEIVPGRVCPFCGDMIPK